MNYSRMFTVVACLVLNCSGLAQACNVPVYRFALERWRPDPYRIVLFHRGTLAESDRLLLASLEEQQDQSAANLRIQTVDVSTLEEGKDRELLASHGNPQLPWLVARYPEHLRIEAPAWQGGMNGEALARLSDSPARQELVKRLVDGQTAVWLFLESGNPDKDTSAVALLEAELRKQEQDLKLPELTDSPDDALLTTAPLKVSFSLLRLARGDAKEQALIEMLLHAEPDLAERSDPLVFPVFGRGRALFPLVGAGITAVNIRESASFLVGPCSCQVKELNPGFDLLLAANWDSLLSAEGVALTAVATEERTPPGDPVLVPIPGGAANGAPAENSATSAAAAHRVQKPVASGEHAGPESFPSAPVRLNAVGIALVSCLALAGGIMAVLLLLRR